jgi:hypothetical protein
VKATVEEVRAVRVGLERRLLERSQARAHELELRAWVSMIGIAVRLERDAKEEE